MDTDAASLDRQVEKLRLDWDQLSTPDRDLKIKQIDKGLSIRRIANGLGRSEASLRNIVFVIHAPAADLTAARAGALSTYEVVRHAKAELQRKTAQRHAKANREQAHQADKGAKQICDWLRKERIPTSFGAQIIEVLRNKYMWAWNKGIPLPEIRIPEGRSPAELIRLCRPNRPIRMGLIA